MVQRSVSVPVLVLRPKKGGIPLSLELELSEQEQEEEEEEMAMAMVASPGADSGNETAPA